MPKKKQRWTVVKIIRQFLLRNCCRRRKETPVQK
jgi:hypothetical protein